MSETIIWMALTLALPGYMGMVIFKNWMDKKKEGLKDGKNT